MVPYIPTSDNTDAGMVLSIPYRIEAIMKVKSAKSSDETIYGLSVYRLIGSVY